MNDKIKKAVAYIAVDDFINNDLIIGIGSGSTIVYVVERIAYHVKNSNFKIICIPTSFQSKKLIIEHKLILGDLDQYPNIDICIDSADEIDDQLNYIKGDGGCLIQEKIIASNSKKLIIIGDESKDSSILGEKWKKGIPIEVIPMAYVPIIKKLEILGGKPLLRMAQSKLGPLVTDNGMFIIDVDFGKIDDPKTLNEKLIQIPGVIETGLFINMTKDVYIGKSNGYLLKKEYKKEL